MTPLTSDISVIICCYTEERWHDIVDAIQSLKTQNLLPLEIILVVDHNQKLLNRAQANLQGVKIVENTEPNGLSGARNAGIGSAEGSLIAFLDDDAVAAPDWLEKLNEGLKNPQLLGVGGSVEPDWLSGKPAWFPEEFYWTVGCTYRGVPTHVTEVRNPYGGCACYRREIFEKIGGFRNGIGRVGKRPLGGEETELSIRATQAMPERTFLYQPAATIKHRIPAVRATWKYFRLRCYSEGLSKAFISQLVGRQEGLASERAYTFKTLPAGVLRGLRDAVAHRDINGLLRAVAIIMGLLVTTCGYLVGTYKQLEAHRKGLPSTAQTLAKQPIYQVRPLEREGGKIA